MKPVSFPEENRVWAENQDEYLPLPSYMNHRENISKWQLTLWERIKILFTGILWQRQLNFGADLQPQAPTLDHPFVPVTRVLKGEHIPRVRVTGRHVSEHIVDDLQKVDSRVVDFKRIAYHLVRPEEQQRARAWWARFARWRRGGSLRVSPWGFGRSIPDDKASPK